jgi:hypothetical protein
MKENASTKPNACPRTHKTIFKELIFLWMKIF